MVIIVNWLSDRKKSGPIVQINCFYFNLDIHTDLQKSHLQNCHNKRTNGKDGNGEFGV